MTNDDDVPSGHHLTGEQQSEGTGSANNKRLDVSRVSEGGHENIAMTTFRTSQEESASQPSGHSITEAGEPRLAKLTSKIYSDDQRKIIEDTTSKLQEELGSDYSTYAAKPKEHNRDAVVAAKNILIKNGYTDIRVVEMGIWANGRADAKPLSHYVVMAKKGDVDIVVDLTAGRFKKSGFYEPYITTKDNWVARWQEALSTRPRVLVKLASVNSELAASTFNPSSPYTDARKVVPGGELLRSPAWYQNAHVVGIPEQQYALSTSTEHVDESALLESAGVVQQTHNFNRPFGPESYIVMGPGDSTLIIRAHGYPGDTGHYTADHVAGVIRDYLSSRGIRLEQIRHVELQSCYGATFGKAASQSQAIANHLGVKVKGYHGKFSESRAFDPDDGTFYKPQKSLAVAAAVNTGNRGVYHLSEAALTVRRKLGIGQPTSTHQGQSSRRYPLQSHTVVVPDGVKDLRLGKNAANPVAQEKPPYAKEKAGLSVSYLLALNNIRVAEWQQQTDISNARIVLQKTEQNLFALKTLTAQNDPDLKSVMGQYFEGENVSAGDIQQVIDFIHKVRVSATDDELREFTSGTLPERFSGDVPAIFLRLSPERIVGFYMEIFALNK